jgi:hypothetical protein
MIEALPVGFDPMLLSAFLITGYPNATSSIDGSPIIFRDHSYEYRRNLRFRDGGELNFRATCTLKDDHIHSRFHLSGHVHASGLQSVEPIVESWEAYGPGGIRGHFTIAWRTKTGLLLVADASTTYQIETDQVQDGMLHRFILMRTTIDGKRIHKVQTVGLFRELPKSLWVREAEAVSKTEELFKK